MDLSITPWISVLPTFYSAVRAVLAFPVILAVYLWFWHNWRYQRVLESARKLPTVFPVTPVLGNWLYLIKNYKEMAKALYKIGEYGKRTTCFWVGPHPVFFLNSAEDIQAVISESKSEKSSQYGLIKFAVGNGLITAPEEIHKITRRYINPLFQPRNLQHLLPVFNESSRHLVRNLSGHVGRGHIDIRVPIEKVALRNIACVIFGADIEVDMDSEEFEGLVKLGKGIGRMLIQRTSRPWLWVDSIFRFLCRKEIDSIHQRWRMFTDGPLKILEYRAKQPGRKYSYDFGYKYTIENNEDVPKTLTLPDTYRVLRADHSQFTPEDLHFEMITLVIAGADTSTIAISSCLLALAAYPDFQDKLFQEIMTVLGPSDKDVTVQDLHNMPYLDQVLKETLRKFNIVPVLLRTAKEDIRISDCTIPAKAAICINLVGLHLNPDDFPDPYKFDPERFSSDRASKVMRNTFLPFSSGSRNCIGTTYSSMLVKTVLIHVLRRYRLTTTIDIDKLNFKFGVVLTSEQGYKVALYPRNGPETGQNKSL